jgi:hypothetical protein
MQIMHSNRLTSRRPRTPVSSAGPPAGFIDRADPGTDGLLGSASLLASAQLLSRRTSPLIGPASAPGAILSSSES